MNALFTDAEQSLLAERALPIPTWSANRLTQCQNVALFGAGSIGKMLAHELRLIGITPFCFLDNNPKLWGTSLSGIKVLQPGSQETWDLPIIITSNIYTRPIVETIQSFGYSRWTYYSAFPLFAFCDKILTMERLRQSSEIQQAWNLFRHSNESADVFRKALASFVTHQPNDYPACILPQYFCFPSLNEKYAHHFVDCGSYTGDTLADWLKIQHEENRESHYYGIEPDPNNIKKLTTFVQELPANKQKNITIHPYACGNTMGSVQLLLSGSGSTVIQQSEPNSVTVPMATIDHLMKDKNVSTIKIDIEGFEMQALQGALDTICKQRPLLMVCVYHKAIDLWEIPLWIDSLNLGYTFELRFHECNQLSEIVCYAIPVNDKQEA